MPILNVKVSAHRSQALSQQITNTLLDLTERILRKNRKLTAVVIDYVDPQDWFIGGESLAALDKRSFYFDVKVVDETNTKAEKLQYIAEAFAAMAELLGNLHEESYIHVEDVRATAYGYGGKTQEFRFHHPG
ncbi:tautomerase family protein [Ideonella sp. YS5]|uniref:tautomerase family protein n=1 Tax=Ideonella sp. YS5 TaxID=3453714 RepID=UPI003EED6058